MEIPLRINTFQAQHTLVKQRLGTRFYLTNERAFLLVYNGISLTVLSGSLYYKCVKYRHVVKISDRC